MSLTDTISQAGYNVTIEPSSPAMPVDDPEITEIIDLVTGDIKDTKSLTGALRYGELITERVRLRESLKQNKPTHACAYAPRRFILSPASASGSSSVIPMRTAHAGRRPAAA
jgi:hypothetical protein